MVKQRINWLDVMKCLGIFAIYLGHLQSVAGYSYLFVFKYHVALFFFISGCIESLNTETSIFINIKKKFVQLIIPFFFFAVLSIVFYAINSNCGILEIPGLILQTIQGAIRNQFIAYTLWFLSCLFVMSIIFEFIKKVKYKILMFIISLILYIVAVKFFSTPKLYWNVDTALYYIIYYCIGFIMFPSIQKIQLSDKSKDKIVIIISGTLAFLYSAILFFGKDALDFLYNIPIISLFVGLISALIIIWLNIVISFFLQNIVVLQKIGQSTLYLCGSEYIIKMIFPLLLNLVGLSLSIVTPLSAIMYTVILLLLVTYFIVPLEKRLLNRLIIHKKEKVYSQENP